MTKNIALFMDGTWNDADKSGATNVHKLYHSALVHQGPHDLDDGIPVAKPGAKQVVHYLEGVGTGTGRVDKYRGGLAGFGTAKRIQEAYRFLAMNYDRAAGDRVYLFGFSRGAFAARALAGFVGLVGLLLKNAATETNLWLAYQLYKRAGKEGWSAATLQQEIKNTLPDKLEKVFPPAPGERLQEVEPPIYVHFIGVWDTVKKLGLPGQPGSFTKHYDNPLLPHHITHARHALALHDLRPEFEPTLWKGLESQLAVAPHSSEMPSLQQVWFPGAHADVGGGYTNTDLSDVALAWMASESEKNHLCLGPDPLRTIPAVPSGNVHAEIMLQHLAPRRILADWVTGCPTMIESFFMHDIACKQLLNSRPRAYISEISKSTSLIGELAAWRKRRIYAKDRGTTLERADQLALELHLRLSFKYGKRPVG
jgi:uncharacterized protein (DUF2235 family)